MTDGQTPATARVAEAERMLRSLISERRRTSSFRLPTEKELSAQLGVPRSTLRSALARLEVDGEIIRQRKVGTLITSPRARGWDRRGALAYPVNVILSLSEYLVEVGAKYAVRSVTVSRDPADEEVAGTLGLSVGSDVFMASRLYEVEDRPTAILEHVLPATLHGHEVHIESLTEGITTFLQDTEHLRVIRSESTITAQAASAEFATALQVAAGTPLLVMRAELYAEESTPVALGRLVFRPDILCLSASASEDTTPSTRGGLGVVSQIGVERQADPEGATET